MLQGRFILPDRGLIVPNLVVQEGAQSLLAMALQNDLSDINPGLGESFYIGLCDETGVAEDAILGDLSELSSAGTYARQQVARSSVGWPTLNILNGQAHAKTLVVTFSAVGVDFNKAFSRFFLCNVLSGTVGKLYSISSKIDPAILVTAGNSENVQYELFW